jgi:cyclopropane fatty-acyl-phospholipid synthase-like methyltransferase
MNPVEIAMERFLTNKTVQRYIQRAYFANYPGSRQYWEDRYATGGDSGAGSYGELANFKSDIINNFISENDISDIIEFGCGDGNQLSLMNLPTYIGLDVSPTAIRMCKDKFEEDSSKSFFLYDPESFVDNHDIFSCELVISLDVIYHLTEDKIYQNYMKHLFSSSKEYVIIYSADTTDDYVSDNHVQHRKFTDWVESNADGWKLVDKIDNKYPYDSSKPESTSWSDFYIFRN